MLPARRALIPGRAVPAVLGPDRAAIPGPGRELDWGHIDYFEWKPGCYRLEGEWEWGIMEITGDNVQVTVTVDDTDSPA